MFENFFSSKDRLNSGSGQSREIINLKNAVSFGNESIFRRVVDNAPDGIQIMGLDGGVQYSNNAVEQIFGYSPKELEGTDVNRMNADPKFASKVILPAIKKTGAWEGELLVKHKKGHTFPIWLTASMIFGKDGKPQAIVGVIRDITVRKLADLNLQKSEERYKTLVESARDIIFTLSIHGTISSLNPVFETLTGWRCSDWVGKNFRPIVHAGDLPRAMLLYGQVLAGRKMPSFELRILSKSGKYIPMDFTATPEIRDGKIVGVIGVAREIIERKKAEEDLLKFKLGLERSTDAVFITDIEGAIIYTNPAFEKIYGYKKEEAVGKTPRIIKSGTIPAGRYKQFWGALLAKQTIAGEIVNKRKNGDLVNIEGSNNPIVDDAGRIVGFLAIHRDITERKKAEEEMKKTNERLEEAQKVANFGNWEWDLATNKLAWSDQVYVLYGLDPEKDKINYKTVIDTLAPECKKDFLGAIENAIKNNMHFEGEYCIIRPDGEKRYTHTIGSVVRDGGGKPVKMFGIVQDITERKAVEKAKEKLNRELKEKVEELERFNKMAIGRELKMIELKNKISELEGKRK